MWKYLLYLLLLLYWPATAQMPVLRPHPPKDLGNIRFSAVFQDSRGWLWCGTEQGALYRYDGSIFHSVGLPNSLRSGAVTALCARDGRRQQLRLLQRRERLVRKSAARIDIGGVLGGDLGGDPRGLDHHFTTLRVRHPVTIPDLLVDRDA